VINSSEFTARLQKIIDFYDETASSFAEKIGVQRSSISHILSGRNKPSLDFIMKILHAYPDIELYWLLNGKGHFPKPTKTIQPIEQALELTKKRHDKTTREHSEIDKIVIFFKDGTFKSYEP
jgi:transcriptional regulator with XRE-family HTH domain